MPPTTAVETGEQHTHPFLEVLPFIAVSVASILHWDQFQSMVGIGKQKPQWKFQMKKKRSSTGYLLAFAGMLIGGIALPYAKEILRCVRARRS